MVSEVLPFMKRSSNTLIGIQEEYMDRVSTANSRWSHRRDGGHAGRSRRAAYRQALKALRGLEYSETQARLAIKDAQDMVVLNAVAEVE